MEQMIFGSSYLLRIATFFEELFEYSIFLSVVYFATLIPTILRSRISVFVTERVAAVHFLKDKLFILMGDLVVIHCLLEQCFQR